MPLRGLTVKQEVTLDPQGVGAPPLWKRAGRPSERIWGEAGPALRGLGVPGGTLDPDLGCVLRSSWEGFTR